MLLEFTEFTLTRRGAICKQSLSSKMQYNSLVLSTYNSIPDLNHAIVGITSTNRFELVNMRIISSQLRT